jgi:two-component system, cell cycle response regulator DivK
MARHVSPAVPTVLLVDSAHDDRAMYAEYLRVCGFRVQTADTTDEALVCAREAAVIVTGIRVGGSFDGVELVRRLRDIGATKERPIIVLTACAFEPDQQRSFAAGCDTFLRKPCLPEQLVSVIRAALTHRRVPKATPARAHLHGSRRSHVS